MSKPTFHFSRRSGPTRTRMDRASVRTGTLPRAISKGTYRTHVHDEPGYTWAKSPSTQDAHALFQVKDNQGFDLEASVICDGHSGHECSYKARDLVVRDLQAMLNKHETIRLATKALFETMAAELASYDAGTTCNLTILDKRRKFVHVVSLGDSPTVCYSTRGKARSGKGYKVKWQMEMQDNANPQEQERVLRVHHEHGDASATVDTVFTQEPCFKGTLSGSFRNRTNRLLLASAFGNHRRNYLKGILNTTPIYACHPWKRGDVIVQSSDGLHEGICYDNVGICARPDIRVAEVGVHLAKNRRAKNIAKALVQFQIDSMTKHKYAARAPTSKLTLESTREYVRTNFDNQTVHVFTWE